MKKTINIYNYTDYQKYLKEWYEFKKNQPEGFSYRTMNDVMGFTSPNYLKLIIDGDRHVGRSSIKKIVDGLQLSKLEGEYFSYLVFFAKAKNHVDRNFYYGQIARIRNSKIIGEITNDKYIYYDSWYNPIIRELVVGKVKNKINYSELAREVHPSIHHKQAKKAVELLEDLGFITVDDAGVFHHASPLINTVNELNSCALKLYHSKMIELGKESINNQPSDKREISAATLRVSEKGFSRIKKRIQEFREELLHIAQEDTDVDRVAQINMQLFPVSNPKE